MKALEGEVLILGGMALFTRHNMHRIFGRIILTVWCLIVGVTLSPAVAADVTVFSKAASWEAIGGRDSKGEFFCGMQLQRKSPMLRIFYYNNKPGIHIWINKEMIEEKHNGKNNYIDIYIDNRPSWRFPIERSISSDMDGYQVHINDNAARGFFDNLTRGRFLSIKSGDNISPNQRIGLRGSLFIYDRFQECVVYLLSINN
jgi:hypothetical protein